jgi:hypothetical protein
MKNFLLRNMTMASTGMKYLLLVSFLLTSLTKSVSAQDDKIVCPTGNHVRYTCDLFGVEIDYTQPYFNNHHTGVAYDIVRTEGPASGSVFPVGTTRVTHVLTWLCQILPPVQWCHR